MSRTPAGSTGSAARPARSPVERWLPPLAVVTFALTTSLIVAISGSTLGYDYEAYVEAGRRVLAGQPLYDPTLTYAVGFKSFLYPPQFAVAMVPFALLPAVVALWAWLAMAVAALAAGTWFLPARREVRWAVLLLAGLSWPVLYSIKLGQVGPLLYLAFALAWRFMDRPPVAGAAIAAATLIKVQPGLLFGWALATRQWRTFAAGVAVGGIATLVTVLIVGFSAFSEYLSLLARINRPITTPHNFTPGAIAYQLGVPEATAEMLQVAWLVAVVVVVVAAWFRADRVTSFVVSVVASQMISPVMWDHYALLLLLPTALLLERRHWWAIAIPLAGWLPAPAYPIVFAIALLAPFLPARPVRPAVAVSPA